MDFSKIVINKNLPIGQYEEEIINKLENSSNMIIIGETGSGKTTQIPLMLLKSQSKFQDLTKGKIAVTQPRRLAATSVARYEAKLLGEELGKNVGYKIRFSDTSSEETKLIFMTDGILLREAQIDPLLMNYSVVMVDEAHERNINSDFLIGLLVNIQKMRKERNLVPLKILVTSATLEKEKFESFFKKIEGEMFSSVEVPGRLFPISVNYESNEVFDYEFEAAEKVLEICKSNRKGDILIFMPGKREIEKTKESIKNLPNFQNLNLEIITIHANLPIEEQNRIFFQTNKRKVVIATNIAETSLTVPGIVHVIDSGLIKQMEFDPHTGLNSLVTSFHARKGLEQRKGRAGRIEPGFYYALFTEQSFYERPEFQEPEILRTSLSQVVLIMKKIGISDIESFNFIDKPDNKLIESAIYELKRLGALDQTENITSKGITMVSLPLEPRLANLIIEAQKNKCVESICAICSFLELKPVIMNLDSRSFYEKIIARNPTSRKDNNYEIIKQAENLYKDYVRIIKSLEYSGSDFFTILKIWKLWLKNEQNPAWAEHFYLNPEVLDEGTNIFEELTEISKKAGFTVTDAKGKDLEKRIEKSLISAFRYNFLIRKKNGLYKNVRSKEDNVKIHGSSVLLREKPLYAIAFETIEIAEIDANPKLSARMLHAISEKRASQYFPDIVSRKEKRSNRNRNERKFKRFRNRGGRGRR